MFKSDLAHKHSHKWDIAATLGQSKTGGVIAYLVVQGYGSLVLEDTSEVGEAVL